MPRYAALPSIQEYGPACTPRSLPASGLPHQSLPLLADSAAPPVGPVPVRQARTPHFRPRSGLCHTISQMAKPTNHVS